MSSRNLSNEIEKIQNAVKIINQDLATAQKHAKKGEFEIAEIWLGMVYSSLSIIVQAKEIAQMKAKYSGGLNDE